MAKASTSITSSSTAEYFAKNLQQVGFSSPVKAVLTTLKESVDNSLDACEEHGILPELFVSIQKVGKGSSRNVDLIEVVVEDNGPGLDEKDLPKVFGEYLASSKFGRGQCSRGQQGIGISAATTWAQLTNAAGVKVTTKLKGKRKALKAYVDVDIRGNRGVLKGKESVDWEKASGTKVEFRIDGRVQVNGDGGILTYLEGTTLVNPHLTLHYRLPDQEWVTVERVSEDVPQVPAPTLPHPHTMKLGEFITHGGLYGKMTFGRFLKTGFSRVTDSSLRDFVKGGMPKGYINRAITAFSDQEYKKAFQVIQATPLTNPTTRSVLTVGEDALAKSIQRLGEVDFFSVVTRKPRICDFKPVVVEVALARFIDRGENDSPVQVLRFANRVPLQFDKGACAITKAIESVNWKSYGLQQQRNAVPVGPYVFAVAVTSPFIKFKNASKETIDASDDLVEEIRLALMRAGQKLSRHIKKEAKEADLERKLRHIESFGPILVDGLVRLTGAKKDRKVRAEEGLKKLLGRDTKDAEEDLQQAQDRLERMIGSPEAAEEAELTAAEPAPKSKKAKSTKKASTRVAAKKAAPQSKSTKVKASGKTKKTKTTKKAKTSALRRKK